MKLRNSMLLAGLIAGTLHGQTSATPRTATPRPGRNARGGAAPTRATGLPPTAPGLTGTNPQQPANTGASGNAVGSSNAQGTAGSDQGTNNQPPAPAATANVVVTGRPTRTGVATADNPLLPIVTPGNAFGIRSGTPIQVRLRTAVDSGHARNGDMVDGTLASPLASLPAGTPVRLTVVQSVAAGRLTSYGELSLQVVSIADRRVLSDTITAQGKEGPKELPDAAPARGTEAVFSPDQPITLPAA